MNLLGGRVVIGACSPESEVRQQSMKVGQTDNIDGCRPQRHRRANGRIEHPGSEDDCHAWFSLDNDDIPSRPPFSVKPSDLAAVQRVPAVVDLYLLADMGRMAPRLLYPEKIAFLREATRADKTGQAWLH